MANPYPAGISRAAAIGIINSVAERTAVPVIDILGEDRHRPLIRARHQVYLEMIEAGASYSQAGRLLQRHHTTIMHGVRVARYNRETARG